MPSLLPLCDFLGQVGSVGLEIWLTGSRDMSALPFAGPTASLEAAGLLAFYFPGHSTAADEVCQAGFLGNFFPSLLQIRCQSKEEMGDSVAPMTV